MGLEWLFLGLFLNSIFLERLVSTPTLHLDMLSSLGPCMQTMAWRPHLCLLGTCVWDKAPTEDTTSLRALYLALLLRGCRMHPLQLLRTESKVCCQVRPNTQTVPLLTPKQELEVNQHELLEAWPNSHFHHAPSVSSTARPVLCESNPSPGSGAVSSEEDEGEK